MILDEIINRCTGLAEFERTHGNLQASLEYEQLMNQLEKLKRQQIELDQIKYVPCLICDEPVEVTDKEKNIIYNGGMVHKVCKNCKEAVMLVRGNSSKLTEVNW